MAGMTDRLSDERLRQLIESQMEWHSTEFVVVPMARELLELRAKLAVGPVMPETPSDDVLYASLHPEMGQARRSYRLIRGVLMEEQSR